jgi:hypothetical protein
MHEEITLSANQVIRPGAEFSDRAMDTGLVSLNSSPSTKLQIIVDVRTEFPRDTKLNIQLIESNLTDLSQFNVLEETGDLSEAVLKVGAVPLSVCVQSTNWRFLGLRYVSSGPDIGGIVSARVVIEKPWSTKPQIEARTYYDHARTPPLPERQRTVIGPAGA